MLCLWPNSCFPCYGLFRGVWAAAYISTVHRHTHTYTHPRTKHCLLMRSKTSLPSHHFLLWQCQASAGWRTQQRLGPCNARKQAQRSPKAKVSVVWETPKASCTSTTVSEFKDLILMKLIFHPLTMHIHWGPKRTVKIYVDFLLCNYSKLIKVFFPLN